jgi:pimeloyl-ACP methyl ester carboxylesterase
MDGMARTALNAVDELGWTSFSVLGHSMGGAAALRVATLRPDAVISVAAVTPVSPGGTPLDAATLAAFDDAWSDPGTAIKTYLAPNIRADDLGRLLDRNRASMDKAAWSRYLHNWTSCSFLSELSRYHGPVTLFHGESDPFVTPSYLDAPLRMLPQSKLETLAGAGHYPMVEATAPTQAACAWALRRTA